MKIVDVAPMRTTILTETAVVLPNGSREFVFSFSHPFREDRLCVFFADEPVWYGGQWVHGRERSCEGLFANPWGGTEQGIDLRSFRYNPLGSGVDWDLPRFSERNPGLSVRVTNKTPEAVSLYWAMGGIGILPVVAPPARSVADVVVPASHDDKIALVKSKLGEEVFAAKFSNWDGTDEGSLSCSIGVHDYSAWHEAPEFRTDWIVAKKHGVYNHWWRVHRETGACDVCYFEGEPVPSDAREYVWKRYGT